MRRFLIDTDTASDDAVAIVMALQHPDVHVEALTVVAGNVGLDQAVQNALYTVELCGKETPVYAGRAQPIMRTLETAQSIHGHDGMGDCGLPLHGRTPTAGRGVDVIVDTILGLTGSLSPVMVLALLIIVTMTLSDVMNNTATAVIAAPIAIEVADRTQVLAQVVLAFLPPAGWRQCPWAHVGRSGSSVRRPRRKRAMKSSANQEARKQFWQCN